MSETLLTDALRAAVERRAADEPDWIAAARRRAFAAYGQASLPDRVQHVWRYTDPRRLLPGDRVPERPEAQFGDLPEDCKDGTFEYHAGVALALDGRVLRVAQDPELLDSGIAFGDVRTLAAECPDRVRPHLFRLVDPAADLFEQLSCALFAGGTFLDIPDGLAIDRPFHIAHRVGGDGIAASRSVVTLGENAEATVVFDLASGEDGGETLLHEGIEIHVGPNSRLRVVFVQELDSRAIHAPVIRCRVDRGAQLETVTVSLGGSVVKSRQSVEVAGRGASVRSLGIVFANRRQHIDHHTLMDHIVGHGSSDLDYRTVVADRARSAYTGNLRIGLEGDQSNAHQRNHNLLLSDHARADTIPELEILTNDVQCSHAAAVGPLDEELLHFCQCRGLARPDAKRLVVLGFLEPVISRVPGDALVTRVRDALARRLEGVLL